MKKSLFIGGSLTTFALCVSAQLHSGQEITMSELTNNHFVNVIDSNILSKEYGEETIVKVEAGTKLPLKLDISGPLLSIEHSASPPILVVDQTFYIKILPLLAPNGCIYCGGDEPIGSPQFLFSHDALCWSSFEEFFGGTLNTSVIIDEETAQPVANISLDVQLKD